MSPDSRWSRRIVCELQATRQLHGHSKKICDLQWSHDGALLASAACDRTIRVWNSAHANLRMELDSHGSDVCCLAWAGGDDFLISGSKDQTVRVWNRKGSEVACFNHGDWVNSIACSPVRSLLAVAVRNRTNVCVRDIGDGHLVSELPHTDQIRHIAWSADDATILSASKDGAIRLWDSDSWQSAQTLEFGADARSAVFLPNSDLIAIAGDKPRVAIIDAAQGTRVSELEGHATSVRHLSASPDGTLLATQSGSDGETLIWDCQTWERITRLKTPKYHANFSNFAFHPTQLTWAMTGGENQIVQIWSMPESTEPPAREGFDVFLAHNSKDKPTVRRLAQALRGRGITVWLDDEQVLPGRPWQEALELTIRTTKTAAVLVGPNGIGPWEVPEMRVCLSQFVRRRLPVIPVLLPGAGKMPDLPLFLQELSWVDLRNGMSQRGLDRLEWGITGNRSREE